MPALDLLPAGVQDPFVVGLLLGARVEAPVDGGVEGATEGFADALFDIQVSGGSKESVMGKEE